MTISRSLIALATILLLVPIQIFGQSKSDKDWKLVWSDEFEGKELDYQKWEIEVNAFGGGNNEQQIYTDRSKNVRLENGKLILQLHADDAEIQGTKRPYSSGRIRSKRRGDWKYGRFEASVKIPEGQGLWPAVWLMPTDDRYGGWALSGEIDLMEIKGSNPKQIFGTLHFGSAWPKNRQAGTQYDLPKGSFADGFHKFALEWEEKEMRWYADDHMFQKINQWDTEAAPFPAPFDQKFHLILNLAIGGGFGGPIGQDLKLPQSMEVDYVRVFQKP